MILKFYKYHGTGNDFIIIDDRSLLFPEKDTELVARLCHRRFGIGADGLILLQKAEGYDFRMIYYNADGNKSSMCGNGGRCIVAFAHFLGIITEKAHFVATDGPHDAKITGMNIPFSHELNISLHMQDVDEVIKEGDEVRILNTGSPHYVVFGKEIDALLVVPEARAIRFNDIYRKDGINVNFVEPDTHDHIKVRTYERGVEDETYSCGTGVTASAIANHAKYHSVEEGEFNTYINTPGGELEVTFHAKGHNHYTDVWLKGPAVRVYEGEVRV